MWSRNVSVGIPADGAEPFEFGGMRALEQIRDPEAAARMKRDLEEVDGVTRASQARFYKRASAGARHAAAARVPKPPAQ